jgi:thiol-disulfide isomerase/thioredoxin
MSLETFPLIVCLFATLVFVVIAMIYLLFALINRGWDARKRRLRIALMSFFLAAAAASTVVAGFHAVLMTHPPMHSSRPEFDVPYDGLTSVLTYSTALTAFAVAILMGRGIWGGGLRRATYMSVATIGLFIAAAVGNYLLTHSVQVPAYERYVIIESRDWKTRVGSPAPDFTVTMLDGSKTRLSDLRGKVVLINFFATWCGPCLYELPHLEELWGRVKLNDDFRMLVIDRGEMEEIVASFKANKPFTFPIAIDPEAETFKQFADKGIPRTYLISRDGKILFQTIGYTENDFYRREFATLRSLIDRELATKQ